MEPADSEFNDAQDASADAAQSPASSDHANNNGSSPSAEASDAEPARRRRRGRRGGQRHRRRREARERREQGGATDVSVAADAGQKSPRSRAGDGSESSAGREARVTERARRSDAPREQEPPIVQPHDEDETEVPFDPSDEIIESREMDMPTSDVEDADWDDGDEITVTAEVAAADDEPEPLDESSPAASITVERLTDPKAGSIRGRQEMLINVADPDECRIALVTDAQLDELYMERKASASHVGNIYKGRVTNVEPSIQAAFIDFGLPVNGFLHISDLHPQYFPGEREGEQVGRKTPRRDRPPIQRCLRRGQEVIVQITKEGIGTKGPTMTTYLSLPGRFLVMMPGMAQLGVSRKVEDDDARRKARQVLSQLNPPKDIGFIVRTAGIDRSRRELQSDLNYLVRLWRVIEKRIKSQRSPCELYQESDLIIRTIRDAYGSEVSRIVVDDEQVAQKVAEFLAIANPRGSDRVAYYTGREPLFHRYGIEAEIEKLHSRHVPLPCGGSLVIDPTEALVAIDVNSGRFRMQNNAEESALRVNLEAADEIARQLRLRDLGGVIICDFIDMRMEKNRREVERRLRDALKDHKERAKILRMSKFGIIEMTRQRQRPSFSRSVYHDCPHCHGRGMVKTVESMTLDVMRVIQFAAHQEGISLVEVRVSQAVSSHLLNRKRHVLARLESETGKTLHITAMDGFGPDQVSYSCLDRRGREISLAIFATSPRPLDTAPRPAVESQSRPASDLQPRQGRPAPSGRGGPSAEHDRPRMPPRDSRPFTPRGAPQSRTPAESRWARSEPPPENNPPRPPAEWPAARAPEAPRRFEAPPPPAPAVPVEPAPPAGRSRGFGAGLFDDAKPAPIETPAMAVTRESLEAQRESSEPIADAHTARMEAEAAAAAAEVDPAPEGEKPARGKSRARGATRKKAARKEGTTPAPRKRSPRARKAE